LGPQITAGLLTDQAGFPLMVPVAAMASSQVAAPGACLRRPVSHSRRRVSLLSRSRCAGITGRPSQDVRETVLVVAEAPETEGCHG